MLRPRTVLLAALAVISIPAAALAESFTTRIEPRAYYGGTVTIEQGVRVWRPLPPVRQMIINPDHGTALSLGFTDVRETRTNTNHNYNYGAGAPGYGYAGGVGFPEGSRRGYGARTGGLGAGSVPRN